MITCPICNSKKIDDKIINSIFGVKLCNTCKNAFTFPLPKFPDYSELDFHESVDIKPEGKLRDISSLPKDWKKLISIQKDIIKNNVSINSKILEIGCGEGLLLNELKNSGYLVFGVEPSTSACNRACNRGLNVMNGYFSPEKLNENYDVVIMSHVLEHIYDIEDVISNIKKIVPKGFLMLTQSNYKGLFPRIQKDKWYAWVPDQHYWHFSLNGLSNILNRFGIELVDFKYSSLVHPNNLIYQISKLKSNWADQFTALYRI